MKQFALLDLAAPGMSLRCTRSAEILRCGFSPMWDTHTLWICAIEEMYFLFHSSGEMYFFSVTGAIHVQFINLWKSGISTEKKIKKCIHLWCIITWHIRWRVTAKKYCRNLDDKYRNVFLCWCAVEARPQDLVKNNWNCAGGRVFNCHHHLDLAYWQKYKNVNQGSFFSIPFIKI